MTSCYLFDIELYVLIKNLQKLQNKSKLYYKTGKKNNFIVSNDFVLNSLRKKVIFLCTIHF